MCIVALAWQVSQQYPLLLLANRDEFYARPAAPLHDWPAVATSGNLETGTGSIRAGRDLQGGGTWCGIGPDGRWAAITNVREPLQPPANAGALRSRGELIPQFLTAQASPLDFARQIPLQLYPGFNLLLGDDQQAVFVNNRGVAPLVLAAGLYVLSNASLDTSWFKTERLRLRVSQEVLPLLAHTSPPAIESLAWDIMRDQTRAPDDQLPDTDIGLAWEQRLSSIFIESEQYGTRCTSLITQTPGQGLQMAERVYR